MSSILIYGSDKKQRGGRISKFLEHINLKEDVNNPDIMFIKKEKDKNSIGIEQVRKSIKFLNEKPFSNKNKVVIINRAEILTTQAQNALLKTLEEHPDFAYIILSSKTQSALVETVLSRCKKIEVRNSDIKNLKLKSDLEISELLERSRGERLSEIEKLYKRDDIEIISILDNWICELRKNLNSKNAENIELINRIAKDIENTNINTKLALENLILRLK